MNIRVKLPHNENFEFQQGKPIVVLGANGAGKTRLSVKIEELNDSSYHGQYNSTSLLVHRLSAQKSLTISEQINIRGFENSQSDLFIGNPSQNINKWGYRYNTNPVTSLLNDYDKALSLLFAEENRQLQKAHIADKVAIEAGERRPVPITTVVEQATAIWNEILPQRKIDLSGNGVHVKCGSSRYHGKEMSDGERVMLYMICQTLVLKPNSLLIVDEPELHIHKAIINKLWDKLEECRQDCVFMYITHDLSFAISRNTEDILWVKSYDGADWNYEFLKINDYSDLPNELLYEVIGTRQKVLFVEGEKNSYDHFLYQEIFRDKGYHVIPCGGCQDVVKFVKSKRGYEKFNSIEVFGIVDRDFRSNVEIEALKADGVFCLDVAEVENLFIVPGLLDIMAEQLGCTEGAAQSAKDFIKSLFAQNRDSQIGEAFIKEINHQLTVKNYSDKKLTAQGIKTCLDTDFSIEQIQTFFDKKQQQFNAVSTIDEILQIFNFKDLSKKIGAKFGINGNEYPQRVINMIKRNPNHVRERILKVLLNYIPEIP